MLATFAAAALLTPTAQPPHLGVVTAASSRHPLVCMLAKKGPKQYEVTREEDPENFDNFLGGDENDENSDDNDDKSRGVQLVDAMTTSLGREDELQPFPGPPVFDPDAVPTDPRPLFALFTRYSPGHAPNALLSQAYTGWLDDEEGRHEGQVSICLPHYLLTAQTFDDYWELGGVLTDDDIARLDAEEEAELATAAAAAAASEDEEAEAADFLPANQQRMEPTEVAFVSGHLTVCRASSHAAAAAWMAGDPVAAAGGYAESELHEWSRSAEPELNIQPTGECLQPYCIYCLDRADAGDLRAKTRDAHLLWLRESGRVRMAGPLVTPSDDRVGTLLLVNGDDLAEVEDWAKSDPYNGAGLFASVTVAPLNEFSLESAMADV